MKLGIHAYAWCSQWTDETLYLIDKVKGLGLDFIEIPLMRLETVNGKKIKERLREFDLDVVTSTVLLDDTDISDFDENKRKNGVKYLKECVKATHDMGARSLSGVIYSRHVKPDAKRPGKEEWEFSAECLRETAVFARDYGVTLGLEPVNRYETHMVNTCAQALYLKNLIDMDNVKIHLDTYHMNIEEKSFYEATRLAGGDLIHIHLCENDRGIPGTGLVDWDGIFKALHEIGYEGYGALESFVDATDNMNTWVWRQLAPDGETLVKQGVEFIKKMQKKYDL